MSAAKEAGVNRVALDPNRIENARRRVASALRTAHYHERQAAAEYAKVAQLVRTWGLCPEPDESDGFCCNNPLECQGRQP